MKRAPIATGDECAFWTVVSGPTSMFEGKGSQVRRPHWWVRCRCGTERFLADYFLRRLRDGAIIDDRWWSCGCLAYELRRSRGRGSQSESYYQINVST